MGSQFVDFNSDGHLDFLTATFDGSPHISYGSAEGFGTPERLKDAQGERIIISSIWNYDTEQHENLGRSMPDGQACSERCISALAFDWDADGDYDLLLGGYEKGHLYRQMNEGTNAQPKFTGKNIAVMAGDKPFELAAKMTTPRLVDWDGDGDMDLIAGSFGDSYGQEVGGGVYLSLNTGAAGKPAFGALQTLIPPSAKGETEPTRPDAGLYADAVDYDGDGDLDLVVGGYSMWAPAARALSDEEQATVADVRKQQSDVQARQQAVMQKINADAENVSKEMDPTSKEYREVRSKSFAKFSDEYKAISQESQALAKKLGALVPGPMRETFVWLYERQ